MLLKLKQVLKHSKAIAENVHSILKGGHKNHTLFYVKMIIHKRFNFNAAPFVEKFFEPIPAFWQKMYVVLWKGRTTLLIKILQSNRCPFAKNLSVYGEGGNTKLERCDLPSGENLQKIYI